MTLNIFLANQKKELIQNQQENESNKTHHRTAGSLEHELDKAVENGDLVLATKISDQIAQKNYETIVSEAIERKEYNEAKEREEAFKAKKKKPKLRWGFETKQRWETKSNM
ncbi:4836_t:CDS:2 [Entrophospora sp. SA101]|nr:4836_t:CDS:2 [Entrophospora sp. SA101]